MMANTLRPTAIIDQGQHLQSCHLILAQGGGEDLNKISAVGHDFIHIDTEYSDFACADCHTGGIQKE